MNRLSAIFFVIALSGCTSPGLHMQTPDWRYQEPPQPEYELVPLTAGVVSSFETSAVRAGARNPALDAALKEYAYTVGPKDVLSFTVWDHPELTIPAGEFRSAEIQGHLVSAEGTIFFPYVGEVDVVGKTLSQIRSDLTERLSRYIQNPQLDVRIASFRSKKVNVVGEVAQPGFFPVTDIPMTLVEAVNLAGGASPGGALQRVQLIRGGEARVLDMQALFDRGDLRENVLLQDGDIVYVPDNRYYAVHALGSVLKPGVVPITRGRLNLAEVITMSGGFDETSADVRRIFVFRAGEEKPLVYWLDAGSADVMLLATQFSMQPQDVVFVADTPLARWNRMISLILPSIQTLWQTQSFIDNLNDD